MKKNIFQYFVFSVKKIFISQENKMDSKKILKSFQINIVLGAPHLGFA
jgi:hypothetical protein